MFKSKFLLALLLAAPLACKPPFNPKDQKLYPNADPQGVIPSLSFGGVANQTFANTAFNGTPFDQKFMINNFMNNTTKVLGKHSLKAGVYYQRANNKRTSFGPVQSNLAFGATFPEARGTFWDGEALARAWRADRRVFLFTALPADKSVVRELPPGQAHLLLEGGGRRLYSNRP